MQALRKTTLESTKYDREGLRYTSRLSSEAHVPLASVAVKRKQVAENCPRDIGCSDGFIIITVSGLTESGRHSSMNSEKMTVGTFGPPAD